MHQKATFHIDDHQFRIIHCEYSIKKPTDYIDQPTGEPAQKKINLLLQAEGDEQILQEWAESEGLLKSGHIFFVFNEKLNRHRTLYFINASCTSYKELPPQEEGALPQVQLKLLAQEFSASSSSKYIDLWTRKEEDQRLN